ncbi:MAG: DUF488 domain-containing protein [Flavobacteriales bacterium]|nr:DUF488 domain-containing protein [Flavobacteriales bacterium]
MVSDAGTLTAVKEDAVRAGGPAPVSLRLYTIGYEGLSLNAFMDLLTNAGVAVLCDVRRNAFSMKRGFKKGQLAEACESVGIRYEHLPGLGIASNERKDLATQADRDALFRRYVGSTLSASSHEQDRIVELLADHGRVAIMCFEADPATCHRSHLAATLEASHPGLITVHHLRAS